MLCCLLWNNIKLSNFDIVVRLQIDIDVHLQIDIVVHL